MVLKLIVGHSHLFTLEPKATPVVLEYLQHTLVSGTTRTSLSQLRQHQSQGEQEQQKQQEQKEQQQQQKYQERDERPRLKLKEILEKPLECREASNAPAP